MVILIDHLRKELSNRCRRNPNYSLRAFSKSLRIDSATLSALLSGKRKLTPKTGGRLLQALELDPLERKEILLSLLERGSLASNSTKKSVLSEVEVEAIAGWEHYAILSLLEIKAFKTTLSAISTRLNITTGVALEALERLKRLGAVTLTKGIWTTTGKSFDTTYDIPSHALRKAHRDYINRALYSLEQHTVEEREFSGTTMAISKKKVPQAKKMIRKFQEELSAFLENGEKDDVYRLNIQLFPIRK